MSFKPSLQRLVDIYRVAHDDLVKAAIRTQRTCLHKEIAETPYAPNIGFGVPPLRLCLQCGYHEEKWGGRVLCDKADRKIVEVPDRDQFYRMYLPVYVDQHTGEIK